jgi:hypothetical protein
MDDPGRMDRYKDALRSIADVRDSKLLRSYADTGVRSESAAARSAPILYRSLLRLQATQSRSKPRCPFRPTFRSGSTTLATHATSTVSSKSVHRLLLSTETGLTDDDELRCSTSTP